MFLQLGTYKFEVGTLPQSWSNSKETLYGQVAIIGGKPVVQQVGEKLEEIELSIFLSSEFCTPKTELEALHAIRTKGVVSQLVDGTGRNYGKFVITSINEDNINALPDGYVTDSSATLHLLEYNTTDSLTLRKGKALSTSKPIAVVPLVPLQSPTMGIMVSMKAGNNISNQLSQQIAKGQMSSGKLSEIQSKSAKAISSYNQITAKIDAKSKLVLRGATTVKSKINETNATLTNINILSGKLKLATDQIKNTPGAVLGADSLQDYVDLANNGNQLSGLMYSLNIASSPFAAVVGSRESV